MYDLIHTYLGTNEKDNSRLLKLSDNFWSVKEIFIF